MAHVRVSAHITEARVEGDLPIALQIEAESAQYVNALTVRLGFTHVQALIDDLNAAVQACTQPGVDDL